MSRLKHDDALKVLAVSESVGDLTEAVASLVNDPETKPEELLPALAHAGYVSEYAAIALHRLTGLPWRVGGEPILDREFWEKRLRAASCKPVAKRAARVG